MADHTAPSDPYAREGFLRSPDGSFTRMEVSPEMVGTTPISSYADGPVLAKDITINQSHNVWIRVFLPRQIPESSSYSAKLPLLIFFHGGAFIKLNAASKIFEHFYTTATVDIPAVFVSVNYRLAPEHRLPTAYDDAMEVLHWIKNSPDEWFSEFADISNTYVMGISAGGNIAYQVGLQAASIAEALKPLNIKGLILGQPFFGGMERTQSEIRNAYNEHLPFWQTDIAWELALPIGADRDHEYCNPMMGSKPDQFDRIITLGWKILITGEGGDPLFDKQIEFFKMLQQKGVDVEGTFEEGGYHGNVTLDPSKCIEFCKLVKEFVASCMAK